jgi:vacuolar-type H+-ATPase subunit E/Vma4
MTLESLIDEIRAHGEAEVKALAEARSRQEAEIAAARDRRITELRTEGARSTELEAARVKAQRIAAAKLAARKLLYAAREQRLSQSLEATRAKLAEFTDDPEYANVLKRMFSTASDALGAPLKVTGRAEDAALLRRVAGKSFDATPRTILGGLIAETPDGRRRLDFSFDELLRLRGDKVRELVA